jgi:formyl-CoA transferase
MLNSNKLSATLNLKSPRGVELLFDMVKRADVLLENFAPGTMARLGPRLGDAARGESALVYGSGSGYGLSGPYRDYPAMDLTLQAMAGIMSVTGSRIARRSEAGPAICDFMGGVQPVRRRDYRAVRAREDRQGAASSRCRCRKAVYASLSSNLGPLLRPGANVPCAHRQPSRRAWLSRRTTSTRPSTVHRDHLRRRDALEVAGQWR